MWLTLFDRSQEPVAHPYVKALVTMASYDEDADDDGTDDPDTFDDNVFEVGRCKLTLD